MAIIQGDFFQLIPVNEHSLQYDLKLLYKIGGKNPREEYKDAGAIILSSAEEVYDKSDIILKVKEPLPSEYKLLKKNQILLNH